MARKKRPVALFEVIQRDKRFQKKLPLGSPVRVARSWFRWREPMQPIVPMQAIVPAAPLNSRNAIDKADSAPAAHETLVAGSLVVPPLALATGASSAPLSAIGQSDLVLACGTGDGSPPQFIATAPSIYFPEPNGGRAEFTPPSDGGVHQQSTPQSAPRAPLFRSHVAALPARPSQWELASQRLAAWWEPRWPRIVALVSRQSSVLTGASAALSVIFGILIARHLTRVPQYTIAGMTTIDQLRAQPAHVSVLDVAGATRLASDVAAEAPQTVKAAGADAQPATNASVPTRQMNLNYVLMQNYADEKTATDARDFLQKNGIPCSIERGVKGWSRDAYQVVGYEGFAHISGPDYVAYRKRILTLSDKYAPQRGYKRFDPLAVKWTWTQ
jgi:hypothetical protein